MLRIWLLVCLFLFAPGLGGLMPTLTGAVGEVCTQRCPDDDDQGQCAPDCIDCTCCGHVRSVAAQAPQPPFVLLVPRPLRVAYEKSEPLSADVGDILHVPIAPLA
ncbi:hypothetical protein HUW63_27450 [Myxococcus sp. AM001]|nr:hypothetical protein [Myxococcus sp. AM001]